MASAASLCVYVTGRIPVQAAPTNLSGSLPAVGSHKDDRKRSYRGTAASGGTAALAVTHASVSADGMQAGNSYPGMACCDRIFLLLPLFLLLPYIVVTSAASRFFSKQLSILLAESLAPRSFTHHL